MWLLDVNMPRQVIGLLAEFGVESRSAEDLGWGALTNGVLVEAAVGAGFRTLLTRDKLFGESASKALRRFPEFSVVWIVIPQMRGPAFVSAFREEWTKQPILPGTGAMVRWP